MTSLVDAFADDSDERWGAVDESAQAASANVANVATTTAIERRVI